MSKGDNHFDNDPANAAVVVCGEALKHHRAGRLGVAENLYRASLVLDDLHSESYHNLGLLYIKSDRLDEGLRNLKRALELAPEMGGYWISYAEGLLIAGRFDEADTIVNRAVALGVDVSSLSVLRSSVSKRREYTPPSKPRACGIPLARQEKVVNLMSMGRLEEAENAASRLTNDYPQSAFSWKAIGTILFKRQEYRNALSMLQQSLVIEPADSECLNTIGNVLLKLGRVQEALDCFDRALAINPGYAAAHNSRGVALKDSAQLEKAIESLQRALALEPNLFEAHNNLGAVLKLLGRLSEAEASHRRALEINPTYAEAFSNLGGALQELGRLDDAIDAYDESLRLNPNPEHALVSNRLFALNYHPDKSAEEIFSAYQEFDRFYVDPRRSSWPKHANDPDPERILRIGYVSPDFRNHSARNFLEPVLARHDRSNFQITAYAEQTYEDEVTLRYRSYVDSWVPTSGLTDSEVCDRIRADGIDILVDLAGHTANNRLGVFALRPAPVSVSWMGYGYTTGLSAIDYFLTDEVMVPSSGEHLFAEEPWRIDVPSMVYRPTEGMGEVGPLPALRRGYITFGTLTRGIRINHRTIRVWSLILKRLPNAKILIDSRDFVTSEAQSAMVERFAEHDIGVERLEIGYHSPPWDVLRRIDIGLDCFPHNSGTTLIESLFMGVPFITLAERPSVGRIGSMMLVGANHSEWIAKDENDYVDKAVALATDMTRLVGIRTRLRSELQEGPWRDEIGFTHRIEDAYRGMWRRWCEGEKRSLR